MKKKDVNYFKRVCKLAGRAIKEYEMIREGDRILVGLSGGKDSVTLMHVLSHLLKRAPVKFELISATFDAGFDGIELTPLAEYARQQGWDHRIVRLDVKSLVEEKDIGSKLPCSFCSRMRRGKLHGLADELGCNKIALGQHLDDLCVSLLIGLFRGQGLKTMGPNVPADAGTKRVIRPLCTTPVDSIKEAARQFDLPQFGHCDYEARVAVEGDRAYLERELERLEKEFPNVRSNMLSSMRDVRPAHLMDPSFLEFPED